MSARVLRACVMQNTADTRQLQFSNSIDFLSLTLPTRSLSDQTLFQVSRVQFSLTGSLPNTEPTVSVVSTKPLSVASSPLHECSTRIGSHNELSLDKHSRLPTVPRWSLCSCMSSSASSSGFCLTDPATVGVGAGLQFVSFMLCNTTLRYFGLGTISVLSMCNTRSRLRCTSCALRSLSRFWNGLSVRGWFWPDPAPVSVQCHGDHPCVPP